MYYLLLIIVLILIINYLLLCLLSFLSCDINDLFIYVLFIMNSDL